MKFRFPALNRMQISAPTQPSGTNLYISDTYLFNSYSTRARWISNVIIQQIITMPIYGKEALNICHPT